MKPSRPRSQSPGPSRALERPPQTGLRVVEQEAQVLADLFANLELLDRPAHAHPRPEEAAEQPRLRDLPAPTSWPEPRPFVLAGPAKSPRPSSWRACLLLLLLLALVALSRARDFKSVAFFVAAAWQDAAAFAHACYRDFDLFHPFVHGHRAL
jgi:hypothetical protein